MSDLKCEICGEKAEKRECNDLCDDCHDKFIEKLKIVELLERRTKIKGIVRLVEIEHLKMLHPCCDCGVASSPERDKNGEVWVYCREFSSMKPSTNECSYRGYGHKVKK